MNLFGSKLHAKRQREHELKLAKDSKALSFKVDGNEKDAEQARVAELLFAAAPELPTSEQKYSEPETREFEPRRRRGLPIIPSMMAFAAIALVATAPGAAALRRGGTTTKDNASAKSTETKWTVEQYVDRITTAYNTNNYTKAVDLCTKFLKSDPQILDTYGTRGLSYFKLNKWREAINDFKAYAARPHSNDQVFHAAAISHYNLGQYEDVIKNYNSYFALPKIKQKINAINTAKESERLILADDYARLAKAHQELGGDYKKAIANWDEAIKYNKNKAISYPERALCFVQLATPEGYQKALDDIDTAFSLDPAYQTTPTDHKIKLKHAEAYATRGLCYLKLKKYTEAIAAYDAAIARNPNPNYSLMVREAKGLQVKEASYHADLGRASMKSEQFFEAKQHYDAAIKAGPEHGDFYCQRAICNFRLNNPDDALRDCKQGMDLGDSGYKCFSVRAGIYFGLGRYDEAKDDYTLSIERDRGAKELYLARAQCYMKLKQYKEVTADYKKYFRLYKKTASEDASEDERNLFAYQYNQMAKAYEGRAETEAGHELKNLQKAIKYYDKAIAHAVIKDRHRIDREKCDERIKKYLPVPDDVDLYAKWQLLIFGISCVKALKIYFYKKPQLLAEMPDYIFEFGYNVIKLWDATVWGLVCREFMIDSGVMPPAEAEIATFFLTPVLVNNFIRVPSNFQEFFFSEVNFARLFSKDYKYAKPILVGLIAILMSILDVIDNARPVAQQEPPLLVDDKEEQIPPVQLTPLIRESLRIKFRAAAMVIATELFFGKVGLTEKDRVIAKQIIKYSAMIGFSFFQPDRHDRNNILEALSAPETVHFFGQLLKGDFGMSVVLPFGAFALGPLLFKYYWFEIKEYQEKTRKKQIEVRDAIKRNSALEVDSIRFDAIRARDIGADGTTTLSVFFKDNNAGVIAKLVNGLNKKYRAYYSVDSGKMGVSVTFKTGCYGALKKEVLAAITNAKAAEEKAVKAAEEKTSKERAEKAAADKKAETERKRSLLSQYAEQLKLQSAYLPQLKCKRVNDNELSLGIDTKDEKIEFLLGKKKHSIDKIELLKSISEKIERKFLIGYDIKFVKENVKIIFTFDDLSKIPLKNCKQDLEGVMADVVEEYKREFAKPPPPAPPKSDKDTAASATVDAKQVEAAKKAMAERLAVAKKEIDAKRKTITDFLHDNQDFLSKDKSFDGTFAAAAYKPVDSIDTLGRVIVTLDSLIELVEAEKSAKKAQTEKERIALEAAEKAAIEKATKQAADAAEAEADAKKKVEDSKNRDVRLKEWENKRAATAAKAKLSTASATAASTIVDAKHLDSVGNLDLSVAINVLFDGVANINLLFKFKDEDHKHDQWFSWKKYFALKSELIDCANIVVDLLGRDDIRFKNNETKNNEAKTIWNKLRNALKHAPDELLKKDFYKFVDFLQKQFKSPEFNKSDHKKLAGSLLVIGNAIGFHAYYSEISALHRAAKEDVAYQMEDEPYCKWVHDQVIPAINGCSKRIRKVWESNPEEKLAGVDDIALKALLTLCVEPFTEPRQRTLKVGTNEYATQQFMTFIKLCRTNIYSKSGHANPQAINLQFIRSACRLAAEIHGKECPADKMDLAYPGVNNDNANAAQLPQKSKPSSSATAASSKDSKQHAGRGRQKKRDGSVAGNRYMRGAPQTAINNALPVAQQPPTTTAASPSAPANIK